MCVGGNDRPTPRPGFYTLNTDPPTFVTCTPQQCVGTDTCAPGYANPADGCSLCAPDHYRRNTECAPCPETTWKRWILILALFVGVALAILAVSHRYHSRVRSHVAQHVAQHGETLTHYRLRTLSKWAIVSIGLNFVQILAVFATINLKWPSFVSNTLALLSVFNLNIDLLATDCSVQWDYHVKWGMAMGLPLVLSLIWGLVWGVLPHPHLVRHVLLSLGYLSLTAKALDPLDCTKAMDGVVPFGCCASPPVL